MWFRYFILIVSALLVAVVSYEEVHGWLLSQIQPARAEGRFRATGGSGSGFPISRATTLPGLAFIHLPKCGGTSLWDLIHTQAKKTGLNPYVLAPKRLDWMGLSQEERDSTDVFGSNHINYYTLLKSWPSQSDNATFVTLFREPRERLASHYFFVKKNKGHHNHAFVSNRTFAEFVRDVMPGYYFQFFVPPDRVKRLEGLGKELRQCCFNNTDLEEIKALLRDRFDVVGVLEELQKTIAVLNCKVPWIDHVESMDHLMQTKHEMPPFDEKDMVRATALDQELYDYARGLLHKKYSECGSQ